MQGNGIVCYGCGSSNVEYDKTDRKIVCYQCGRRESFSRATLNQKSGVVRAKENALKFFKSGKYENAAHYAREALNILEDSVPALFVISFYDEFVAHKMGYMARFFRDVAEIPLLFEETEELRDLILAASPRLLDFEKEIIVLISKNMNASEDRPLLLRFFDELLPYFIKKRGSIDFFSKEQVELYHDLARHCGLPKTCFALLSSIETNPDSPYFSQAFYLQERTRYFYLNFVVPVGSVIRSMDEEFGAEFKSKLLAVYAKKKKKFEHDMEI